MTDDLDTLERVADVLDARLTVCRVLGGKLDALAARTCPDGRMRGALAYYGAHTGRWSGRGAQVQNFPRPPEDADTLRPEEVEDPGDLGGLLRGVVAAPAGKLLVTVDASQIEARVLLWLAGDEEGLRVYREGGDPYRALAATVFGIAAAAVTKGQRAAAKVVTLACGYQGGRRTLAKFAAKARVDLSAVGITAASLVEGWRDAHTAVAGERTGGSMMPTDLEEGEEEEPVIFRRGGLWRRLQEQATRVVRDGGLAGTLTGPMGPHRFSHAYEQRADGHLYLRLPSGRELRYRDALIEDVPSKWTGKPRPTLTYRHPRYGRVSLYGGMLANALTQATARDILAAAILRLEAAGYPAVLHVHDEVVCEVPDPLRNSAASHFAVGLLRAGALLDDVVRIASVPPPWAAGLPITFEGSVGKRWSK